MSGFYAAFNNVIGLEGGYVNHGADRGLETKWGISKRSYPMVDIRSLTKKQAESIYLRDFWNSLGLDAIRTHRIAEEIFEQAVNMGHGWAVYHAQKSLNWIGLPCEEDRRMGPVTAALINKIKISRIEPYLKCLNGFQFMRYVEIVKRDPSQKVFFVGWLKRVEIDG